MEIIDQFTSTTVHNKLKETWDIQQPVWYPLYETKRKDVLAFTVDSPSLNIEFLNVIKVVFSSYEVNDIYQLQVDILNTPSYQVKLEELQINRHHFIEDTYWFDSSLTWIIYACHDGYLTIGGEQFIRDIKQAWPTWENNLF
ncbi:hypothetical protein [Bacillus suaedaesalsae]|uniref:Uncharacterized protein n=1 Tax=Bacillus suaedaesalsae TaxID=2810349 RepID=A0ABS2DE06_9BACI|nr:hypothetical protein [Bacillus suaedaesalsae]MBM6616682.1 hypothetical protein [Bacillus suaedaesalsae]